MAIDSGSNINNTNALAVDVAGMSDLKQAARQNGNSPEAIKGAAKQFEAMFLNMMLKSMRDATPKDGALDSEQSKMFTSMLDQQMSQSLAQRGVGLADVLTRQLSGSLGKPPTDPAQDTGSTDGMPLPFGTDRLPPSLIKAPDSGTKAQGLALPRDDTVTGRVWPGCANGGNVAVTITAATFLSCKPVVLVGRFTPSCCNMLITLCTVNGVCVVWSPLPSRPTTRP